MANLRGSTYEKQIKDAFHRVEAFGVSRHGKVDHLTHSDAVATKRDMYLRDYKDYADFQGFSEKLNTTMTNDNVKDFLEIRLEGLAVKTQEDYARGFSSMLQGLEEKNIAIGANKEVFNTFVRDVKENGPGAEPDRHRAIENVDKVIAEIYDRSYESGVVADIQNQLGVRAAEAIELAQNYSKYIHDGVVEGLIGKGNHVYEQKAISEELIAKIEKVQEVPSYRTYSNHLPTDITSHDFKYTYAEKEFEERLDKGMEYHQALKEVSQELNHSREEMTKYYLNRA